MNPVRIMPIKPLYGDPELRLLAPDHLTVNQIAEICNTILGKNYTHEDFWGLEVELLTHHGFQVLRTPRIYVGA